MIKDMKIHIAIKDTGIDQGSLAMTNNMKSCPPWKIEKDKMHIPQIIDQPTIIALSISVMKDLSSLVYKNINY